MNLLVRSLLLFAIFLATCTGEEAAGSVIILKDSNIEKQIASDYWLVEFYAPWCGHCKKLAPILEDLASSVTQWPEAHIAKIDATLNKNSTTKYDIHAFPTILYFKNGLSGKYDGPRTKEGMLAFVEKMSHPMVRFAEDSTALEEFAAVSPVQFVLSVPPAAAKTAEATAWTTKFEDVAGRLHLHNSFVIVRGDFLTDDLSIVKYETGRPLVVFKPDSSQFSVSALDEFVRLNGFPFFNKFDSHNFKQLGSLGKPLAMVAVDYQSDSWAQYEQAFLRAASALSAAEADKMVFGHIDGLRFAKFLKQYGLAITPSLVVLDLATETYHAVALNEVAAEDLENFLFLRVKGVADNLLEMTKVAELSIFGKALKKMRDYYPWSLLCVLPVIFFTVSMFVPYPEDNKEKVH